MLSIDGCKILDTTDDKNDVLEAPGRIPTICPQCNNPLNDAVILNCLHIFDRSCLRRLEKHDTIVSYIKCPICEVFSGGLNTLDAFDVSVVSCPSLNDSTVKCSVCTDGNAAAYRCLHCVGTLCERCRDIHKVF